MPFSFSVLAFSRYLHCTIIIFVIPVIPHRSHFPFYNLHFFPHFIVCAQILKFYGSLLVFLMLLLRNFFSRLSSSCCYFNQFQPNFRSISFVLYNKLENFQILLKFIMFFNNIDSYFELSRIVQKILRMRRISNIYFIHFPPSNQNGSVFKQIRAFKN